MPAVTQLIPNFLGGVSKQNDDKKLENQVTECINGYPDPTYGLLKRPGMKFIDKLRDIEADIRARILKNTPMVMSASDKIAFHNANTCHFCKKPLNGDNKVRDHDHLSGKYRGAAHSKCNIEEGKANVKKHTDSSLVSQPKRIW